MPFFFHLAGKRKEQKSRASKFFFFFGTKNDIEVGQIKSFHILLTRTSLYDCIAVMSSRMAYIQLKFLLLTEEGNNGLGGQIIFCH